VGAAAGGHRLDRAFRRQHGDGLIDYARGLDSGLSNQNWKDSEDSVFHEDGKFPDGPIAVVEVQGYAFAAFKGMADLAQRRGDAENAERWRDKAEHLRRRSRTATGWRTRASTPWPSTATASPAACAAPIPATCCSAACPRPSAPSKVADTLLSAAFHNGFGVRTLAQGEPRFNPMSYHNGSVWPHDTAICAMGLARYGHRDGVVR
jgi:glycogen debranching enzyme